MLSGVRSELCLVSASRELLGHSHLGLGLGEGPILTALRNLRPFTEMLLPGGINTRYEHSL